MPLFLFLPLYKSPQFWLQYTLVVLAITVNFWMFLIDNDPVVVAKLPVKKQHRVRLKFRLIYIMGFLVVFLSMSSIFNDDDEKRDTEMELSMQKFGQTLIRAELNQVDVEIDDVQTQIKNLSLKVVAANEQIEKLERALKLTLSDPVI